MTAKSLPASILSRGTVRGKPLRRPVVVSRIILPCFSPRRPPIRPRLHRYILRCKQLSTMINLRNADDELWPTRRMTTLKERYTKPVHGSLYRRSGSRPSLDVSEASTFFARRRIASASVLSATSSSVAMLTRKLCSNDAATFSISSESRPRLLSCVLGESLSGGSSASRATTSLTIRRIRPDPLLCSGLADAATQDQDAITSPEGEGIAKNVLQVTLPRPVSHVVQIAFRVWNSDVKRWWHHLLSQREDAAYALKRRARGDGVANRRLDANHRNLPGTIA